LLPIEKTPAKPGVFSFLSFILHTSLVNIVTLSGTHEGGNPLA